MKSARAGRADETGERYQDVLDSLSERDERDRTREHGALRAADDAVEVDTTNTTIRGVVDGVVAIARERGLA